MNLEEAYKQASIALDSLPEAKRHTLKHPEHTPYGLWSAGYAAALISNSNVIETQSQMIENLANQVMELSKKRQPSDTAVEAAARAMTSWSVRTFGEADTDTWDDLTIDDQRALWTAATAGLEAAYRVDAPRPLLDREAVMKRAG